MFKRTKILKLEAKRETVNLKQNFLIIIIIMYGFTSVLHAGMHWKETFHGKCGRFFFWPDALPDANPVRLWGLVFLSRHHL